MAEDMGPRVGAFGDPVAVTPALDRLAAEGVRYPNTFTTAGVCAPSRAAQITGVHQMAIGAQHMRSREGGYLAVPPPEVKAYPELLRRAGYFTFTNHKLDYQFSEVLAGSGPFTIWSSEGAGSSWRERAPGQPFFGLISFQVTHESALFPRGGLPRSAMHFAFQLLYLFEFWGHGEVVTPDQVRVPPYYPDTPVVRETLARHYDNIHRMDEQVADIRRQLAKEGLADSTILVWTTDHGDGLPRAKRELYDSGIRVPLIVHWPERLRPEQVQSGSSDQQLVSFVDLAPTILGLAGLEGPEWGSEWGSEWMAGRAFAGPAARPPARRYVYAAGDRIDELEGRERAVRDARFKYIRNLRPGEPGARPSAFRDHLDIMRELWDRHAAGRLEGPAALWFEARPAEELYDTRADPHEIRNLARDPSHRETLLRMRSALDDWLARTTDLGELPEAQLRERFWPGGRQPVTATPSIELDAEEGGGARVSLSCETPGASLGYELSPRPPGHPEGWRLYTEPFVVDSGTRVEAKAVRYGWQESAVARAVAR